jgi:hypothetical protein
VSRIASYPRQLTDRRPNSKKLSTLLHHLANQNELLTDKNEGLREALTTKKKHNKMGKVLDLQQRQEYHGGAVFWSPRKMA